MLLLTGLLFTLVNPSSFMINSMDNAHCPLHFAHCKLYNAFCTINWAMHTAQCTLVSADCTHQCWFEVFIQLLPGLPQCTKSFFSVSTQSLLASTVYTDMGVSQRIQILDNWFVFFLFESILGFYVLLFTPTFKSLYPHFTQLVC